MELVQVNQVLQLLQAGVCDIRMEISRRLTLTRFPIAASPASLARDECRLINSKCFIPLRCRNSVPVTLAEQTVMRRVFVTRARCPKPASLAAVTQTLRIEVRSSR